jgi:hypothetical protein
MDWIVQTCVLAGCRTAGMGQHLVQGVPPLSGQSQPGKALESRRGSLFATHRNATVALKRNASIAFGSCLLRNSLDFVSWKDRKAVAAALKDIYRAVDAEAALAALETFENSDWGRKYPAIGPCWRRAWTEVVPFYAFPTEVRRILYTTNAIEALNAKLRRAVRARGHFPNDEAALKLLFLVLNRAEKEWTMPAREWCMAKAQFAIIFGERFTKAMV